MDASSLTDDELLSVLNGEAPTADSNVANINPSDMSDDELLAALNGEKQQPPKEDGRALGFTERHGTEYAAQTGVDIDEAYGEGSALGGTAKVLTSVAPFAGTAGRAIAGARQKSLDSALESGEAGLLSAIDTDEWDKTEGTKYDLYQRALKGETGVDYSPIYSRVFNGKKYTTERDENGQPYLDEKYAGDKDEARKEYVREMAKLQIADIAKTKGAAQKDLANNTAPWYMGLAHGATGSLGFAGEFMLGGAVAKGVLGTAALASTRLGKAAQLAEKGAELGWKGRTALTAAELTSPTVAHAIERYENLTADDYRMDDAGNVTLAEEGDGVIRGATKAVAGSVFENATEVALGKMVNKVFGATMKGVYRKVPGVKKLFDGAVGKLGETNINRARVAWTRAAQTYAKVQNAVHFELMPVGEFAEEYVQGWGDDVVGLNLRKDAENKSFGDFTKDFFDWDAGGKDLFFGVMGQSIALGLGGYAGQRGKRFTDSLDSKVVGALKLQGYTNADLAKMSAATRIALAAQSSGRAKEAVLGMGYDIVELARLGGVKEKEIDKFKEDFKPYAELMERVGKMNDADREAEMLKPENLEIVKKVKEFEAPIYCASYAFREGVDGATELMSHLNKQMQKAIGLAEERQALGNYKANRTSKPGDFTSRVDWTGSTDEAGNINWQQDEQGLYIESAPIDGGQGARIRKIGDVFYAKHPQTGTIHKCDNIADAHDWIAAADQFAQKKNRDREVMSEYIKFNANRLVPQQKDKKTGETLGAPVVTANNAKDAANKFDWLSEDDKRELLTASEDKTEGGGYKTKDGTVIMFLDNLTGADDALFTLAHEIGGHLAIAAGAKEKNLSLTDTVAEVVKGSETKDVAQGKREFKIQKMQGKTSQEATQIAQEEAMVYGNEYRMPTASPLQKAKTAVKLWMKKHGMDAKLTDEDYEAIAAAGLRRIRQTRIGGTDTQTVDAKDVEGQYTEEGDALQHTYNKGKWVSDYYTQREKMEQARAAVDAAEAAQRHAEEAAKDEAKTAKAIADEEARQKFLAEQEQMRKDAEHATKYGREMVKDVLEGWYGEGAPGVKERNDAIVADATTEEIRELLDAIDAEMDGKEGAVLDAAERIYAAVKDRRESAPIQEEFDDLKALKNGREETAQKFVNAVQLLSKTLANRGSKGVSISEARKALHDAANGLRRRPQMPWKFKNGTMPIDLDRAVGEDGYLKDSSIALALSQMLGDKKNDKVFRRVLEEVGKELYPMAATYAQTRVEERKRQKKVNKERAEKARQTRINNNLNMTERQMLDEALKDAERSLKAAQNAVQFAARDDRNGSEEYREDHIRAAQEDAEKAKAEVERIKGMIEEYDATTQEVVDAYTEAENEVDGAAGFTAEGKPVATVAELKKGDHIDFADGTKYDVVENRGDTIVVDFSEFGDNLVIKQNNGRWEVDGYEAVQDSEGSEGGGEDSGVPQQTTTAGSADGNARAVGGKVGGNGASAEAPSDWFDSEGALNEKGRAALAKTEMGKAILGNYDANVGDDREFAIEQLKRSVKNNADELGLDEAPSADTEGEVAGDLNLDKNAIQSANSASFSDAGNVLAADAHSMYASGLKQLKDKESWTPEEREQAKIERANWKKLVEDSYNDMLRRRGGWVSPMVAGPAKYNYGKMDKRYDAMMKAGMEWQSKMEKFIENAKKRIAAAAPSEVQIQRIRENGTDEAINSGDENAVEKIQAKIDNLRAEQERMKAENAWFRKHGTMVGFEGISEETAKKMDAAISNDYNWEHLPAPAWSLKNNSANIRRLEKRLEEVKRNAEKANAAQEAGPQSHPWGEVVENADENRLQVDFGGEKPPQEVIDLMKHNGFKWSPRNKVWQRQLTDNARYAMKRIAPELDKLFGVNDSALSLESVSAKESQTDRLKKRLGDDFISDWDATMSAAKLWHHKTEEIQYVLGPIDEISKEDLIKDAKGLYEQAIDRQLRTTLNNRYDEDAVRYADEAVKNLEAFLAKYSPNGDSIALESVSAKQITDEEKSRAQKAEIERRANAPLKGGVGEVGQSPMDLGGAEGEDLFNRTASKIEEAAKTKGDSKGKWRRLSELGFKDKTEDEIIRSIRETKFADGETRKVGAQSIVYRAGDKVVKLRDVDGDLGEALEKIKRFNALFPDMAYTIREEKTVDNGGKQRLILEQPYIDAIPNSGTEARKQLVEQLRERFGAENVKTSGDINERNLLAPKSWFKVDAGPWHIEDLKDLNLGIDKRDGKVKVWDAEIAYDAEKDIEARPAYENHTAWGAQGARGRMDEAGRDSTSESRATTGAQSVQGSLRNSQSASIIPKSREGAQGGKWRRIGIKGAESSNDVRSVLDYHKAIGMEKDGINKVEIWEKTGWWRGRDGEWRREFDDTELLRPLAHDIVKNRNRGTMFYLGAWIDENGNESGKKLLQQYPILRNTKIRLVPVTEKSRNQGGYYPDENEIEISLTPKFREKEGEIAETFAHEIQHAIQHAEGWDDGASWSDFKQKMPTDKALRAVYRELPNYNWSKDRWLSMREAYRAIVKGEKDAATDELVKGAESLASKYGFKSAKEMLWKLNKDVDENSAYGRYLATPGEVEARATESRLKLGFGKNPFDLEREMLERESEERYGKDPSLEPVYRTDKNGQMLLWRRRYTPNPIAQQLADIRALSSFRNGTDHMTEADRLRLSRLSNGILMETEKMMRELAQQGSISPELRDLLQKTQTGSVADRAKGNIHAMFSTQNLSRIRELLQDYQISLKEMEKKYGVKMDDSAYYQFDRNFGMVANAMKELERDIIEPLGKEMRENHLGVADLNMYLLALHGAERNRMIAERSPYVLTALADPRTAPMVQGILNGTNGKKELNDTDIKNIATILGWVDKSGNLTDEAHQFLKDLMGSGATTAWWNEKLADFKKSGFDKKAKKAVRLIRRLTAMNRRLLVDTGRMNVKQAAMWAKMSPHYVPMKSDTDMDVGVWTKWLLGGGKDDAHAGKKYSTEEYNHAYGRGTIADDPVSFAIQQYEESLARAWDNVARQKLADMVRANPNMGKVFRYENLTPTKRARYAKAIAIINAKIAAGTATPAEVKKRDWYQEAFNASGSIPTTKVLGANGIMHETPTLAAIEGNGKNSTNIVAFKEDGELKFIRLGGFKQDAVNANPNLLSDVDAKRIAASVKKHNMFQPGAIVRKIREWTGLFSALRTAFSPTFVVSNFGADNTQAMRNVYATFGVKAVATFEKFAFHSFGAARSVLNGNYGTTKIQQYAKEWAENGGMIGGLATESIKDLRKGVDSTMRRLASQADQLKNIHDIKSFWTWAKDKGADLAAVSEHWNSVVEMSNRIAAYATAREMGKSVNEAVSYSRDITVNFNRKGTETPWINALYAFSNATMQDLHRSLVAFAEGNYAKGSGILAKRGAVMGLGLTVLGFIASMLGYWQDDDDDEKEGKAQWKYAKEYEKQNVMGVRIGGKTVGVPIRGLSRIPYYLGHQIFEAVTGRKSAARLAADTASLALENATDFLGTNPDVGQVITPSLIRPYFEIRNNQTFTGRQMYRMPLPGQEKSTVKSELGRNDTSDAAKWVAKALNRWTGGNVHTPGKIDVQPEKIAAVWNWLFGTAGRDMANITGFAVDTATGEIGNRPLRNIPYLSRFMRKLDENSADYYEARDRYNVAKKAAEGMAGDSDLDDETRELIKENPWLAKSGGGKRWGKELKDLEGAVQKLMKVERAASKDEYDAVHQMRLKAQYQFMRRLETPPSEDAEGVAAEREHKRAAAPLLRSFKREQKVEERNKKQRKRALGM